MALYLSSYPFLEEEKSSQPPPASSLTNRGKTELAQVSLTLWDSPALGLGHGVITHRASFHSPKHTSLNTLHSRSKPRHRILERSSTLLGLLGVSSCVLEMLELLPV